jgi:serine/threonine protein kinase
MPLQYNLLRRPHGSSVSETSPTVDFPKSYKFNRRLQKGSEGHVEQWSHIHTKAFVAVKVITSTGSACNENLILRDLPYHNSIIPYLGYYEKQDKVFILLECCPYGDLFTVRSMATKLGKHLFSEEFMWSLYSQLVGALAFLHEGIDFENPVVATTGIQSRTETSKSRTFW